MRVLHVISGMDPRSGGPTTALVGLAEAQARAGLNVSILTSWTTDPTITYAERLKSQGVHVQQIGPCVTRLGWHPRLSANLKAAVAGADIVHIHALWEEIQHRAARTARRLGVPYIITPHGMLDPWSLNQKAMKKRVYMALRLRRNLQYASAVHFTTQTECDLAVPLKLTAPAILEPNGVDLSEFVDLPHRGTFRSRFAGLDGRPIVVFLGRIHPGKGLEYLIPAMAQLKNRDSRLVIVGPDSQGYQAQMQELVARHKLEDRVLFTGMLVGADRVAALADADLFALPSQHENFGIAVVEALAAGVPVIVSDQVQIQKEIAAGQVGAVVPCDTDCVAAELDRWLGNAPLRQAAAARARPFVWEHYDWQKIAQRWCQHYSAVAGKTVDLANGVPRAAGSVSQPSKATRVLHVISSLDLRRGGPAMALMRLASAQAQRGLKVSVVSTYREGDDETAVEVMRDNGVHVQLVGPCSTRLSWHPHIVPALKYLLPSSDIVHVHALWEEIQHQAARLARRAGKPYIIRACGMLDPWSLSQKWLKKQLYLALRMRKDLDRAAALHFTSQTECDLVTPLRLESPGIIEPNGVDLTEFAQLPAPGAFRSRYAQLADRPIVVFLGRIHPGKGLEYLVPAMAKLENQESQLVIVGPDSRGYRSRVEEMIERLKLQDRVLFTGMLSGTERLAALADADLFALPSEHENFGIAVVEALAAGTPVIVSDQVSIHHEISSAGVGGVVPMEIDALAAELTRWLNDSEKRRLASERARLFVQERYDWIEIAGRWAEHYQRLARTQAASQAVRESAS